MAVLAFSTPELIHVVSLGLAGKSMCRLMALARSLARAQLKMPNRMAPAVMRSRVSGDVVVVLDHRDWQGRSSSHWGAKALQTWAGADGWL